MKVDLPVRRKARIEMLPLIDIVFLLLVVFIYAMLSMAVHKGLPVRLPQSAAVELEQKMTLSVTVQQKGEDTVLAVDNAQVALGELSEVLAARAQGMEGAETGVLLFADSAISYQQLFLVLDRIRKAGLRNVSLQAEQLAAP